MTSLHRPLWSLGLSATGATLTALTCQWAASPAVGASPAWVSPLAGPVVIETPFDPPDKPWLAGHRGVDLSAGQSGSAVRTTGSGVITFAGVIAGRPTITVSHGGVRTTYEPVEPLLQVGTSVTEGQVIGTLRPFGHCQDPCLHWGLIEGQQYLNPLSLLDLRPPVLKSLPPVGVGLGRGATAGSAPADAATAARSVRIGDGTDSSPANEPAQVSQGTGLGTAAGLVLLVATAAGVKLRQRRSG
ncbi:MAG: M23 family metallopeptidase [Actinomycetes bacterium]